MSVRGEVTRASNNTSNEEKLLPRTPQRGLTAPKKPLWEAIYQALTQGGVGAVVGAVLSTLTEPVVNRVLVNRVPVAQALKEVSFKDNLGFFQTTLISNLIKFPIYEVITELVGRLGVSDNLRATVNGAIFTTSTLPITNYRYLRSMNKPVPNTAALFQAYWPTVMRDVLYSTFRLYIGRRIARERPELEKSESGRFWAMFFTVLASCILSSPGNELRGYLLQEPSRALGIREFFQLQRYLRSTLLGATVMALSLGVGRVVATLQRK